jgi:hypothetical protein
VDDTFSLDVDEIGEASFGPIWPGDASAMFPGHLTSSDPVPNSYVAVEALVTNLLASGSILAITANTTMDNAASHRVLTKNGFRQTATKQDPDHGDLLVWRQD